MFIYDIFTYFNNSFIRRLNLLVPEIGVNQWAKAG